MEVAVEIEIENANPDTEPCNQENMTLEVENESTDNQTVSIEKSITAEEIEAEQSNEISGDSVEMKNDDTSQGLEQNKTIGQCKGNELDKFKRRLVRAVARLKISEKMSEDDMWKQLKMETTWDCKPLWIRMRALTIKKLHRLCGVEDRLDLIAKVAQLSVTDWLMFDLVLVHEDVDVIGQEDQSNKEPKILEELFELVKKYNIENYSGDSLTKLWFLLTQEYNKGGRKCSPMLLQRRWYQLKVMVRYKFYNFWFSYRGMTKHLPEANTYKPTELQMEIAKHFVFIVVKEFQSWEELIQDKKVSLPEDFERLHLSKTKKVSLEPDLIVIEPEVETIDLRLDSDASDDESGDRLNEILNENTENTDGVNLAKVKTEIIDDISDEEDVRILESINIPLESQITTEEDTEINDTEDRSNVNTHPLNVYSGDISIGITHGKTKANNALLVDSDIRFKATDVIGNTISEQKIEVNNKVRETSENSGQYNLEVDDTSETSNDDIVHNEYENINGNNLALKTTEASDELMMPKITSVTSSVEFNENTVVDTQVEINAILEGVVGRMAIDKTKYNIPKRIEHSTDIVEINEEVAKVAKSIPVKKPNKFTLLNNDPEEVPKRVEHSTDIIDIDEEIAKVAESIPFKKPNPWTLSNNEPQEVPKRVEQSTHIININKEIAKLAASIPFRKPNSCTLQNKKPEEVFKRIEQNTDITDINEEITKVAESLPFQKSDPCTFSNNEPEDFCFIDGLELEDDGIEFIDEEQGDPVLNNYEEEQFNEDNTPKIDLKLLLDPVVYSKKLDDMDVFRFIDYISVKDTRVIENSILESKPVDKKSIKMEDISEECQNENESDDCSDDASEYSSQEIISCKSWFFKKPKVTSYNPIQLCKNPDFNKRLNRLTSGFFSSERNRWLLKQCKPLTIDLHKSFESKLVNNKLLLYRSVNQSISTLIPEEKISSSLSNQNIINTSVTSISVFPNPDGSTRTSISPVHQSTLNSTPMIHESTLSSTPSSHDEPIGITAPAVPCNESIQLPTTDAHCNNERNKIIHLPNFEQIRRANEKLLVAEVAPIQVTNKALPGKIIPLNDTQVTGQNNNFQPNMELPQATQIPSVSEINPKTKPALQGPRKANVEKLSKQQPRQLKKSIKEHVKKSIEKPVPRPPKLLKPHEYVLSQSDRLLAFDTVERILRICKGNNYSPPTKRMQKNEQIMRRKKGHPSTNKAPEKVSDVTVSEDVCEDIVPSVSEEYIKPINENLRVEKKEKVKSYSNKKIKKNTDVSEYCCWAREMFMFKKLLIANVQSSHTCPPRRCTCCCKSLLKKPRKKKKQSYTVGKVFPPIDLISDDESERTITRNSCRPIWRRTIGINTDFDPEFAGSLLEASRTFNIDLLIKNKLTDTSNNEINLHDKVQECYDIRINQLVEPSNNENQTNECDTNKVDEPSDETLAHDFDNNELNRPMERFSDKQRILECENDESNESNKLVIAIDSGIIVNNTKENEKLSPVITNVQSLLQKPQIKPNKKINKIILSPRTPKKTASRCKTNVVHSPGPKYRVVPQRIMKKVPANIIEQPPESLINIKMLTPDNNVFLINDKSNYLPPQKPIFLGKNKILLCSFKPVVSENEETLDNEVIQTIISNQADVINNIHEQFKSRLPQGVHLVLVRNREVALSINPSIELDTTQLAELPAIMALVQEQFDTKALEQIKKSRVKQIHYSDEVIQLEDDKLSDLNDTHKSSQIEIPEDTNNVVLGDNAIVNISLNKINSINETVNIRSSIECSSDKIVVQKSSSPTTNENEINISQSKHRDETLVHNNSGDQSVAETAKKTILSDLMEMSGISAEDTYISNNDNPPNQQINVVSTVQSPSNESEHYVAEQNKSNPSARSLALPAASDLNIITSFVELKYCYENNGHFYKMDINTGQIAPIKVCIKKQNVKSETKHLDPKAVIDLTDEPEKELESTSKPIKVTVYPISDLKNKEPQAVKPVKLFKAVHCPPIIRRSGKALLMDLTKNNPEFQAKRRKLIEIMEQKRNQMLSKEHTSLMNKNKTAIECNETSESLEPQKVESDNNSDSDDEPLALKVKRRKSAEKKMAVDVNKEVQDQSQEEIAISESGPDYDVVANKSDAFTTDVQPQLEPVAYDDSSDEDCILGV